MSRSRKGSKAPGFDYWGRRPAKGGTSPSSTAKRVTNRQERRIRDRDLRRTTDTSS